jgi:hypothetical protein
MSDPWTVDWRDDMPNALLSPTGPRGEPIKTSQDRRWLWHVEGFLAVSGTTPAQHLLGRKIRAYLNETCEHHWLDYKGDADIPAHLQCMWCCDVEWIGASS